jgi:hypothetical protein
MIPSPCIKLCVIDPTSGLCAGCLRTIDEIAAWPSLDDAQQRALLAELAQRELAQGPRAASDPGPTPMTSHGERER